MNFAERRKQVFEKMERQSALILFSGIESHVSADEYAPFEADRNFFYLTGLRRDHMILLMKKTLKEEQVILFIEEADPTQERWYGRKVTVDEAKEISGIDNVMFLDSFEGAVDRMMAREDIDSLYFDCYRYQFEDMPDYNMIKAKEFAEKYPGHAVKNISQVIAELRMQKDGDEVALVREAIGIIQLEVKSDRAGFVKHISAKDVGLVSMHLGGGRVTKESVIDLSVGVILNKKVADRVELDESLGVIHAQTTEKAQEAAQLLRNCYTKVDEPVEKSKFIKGIVK